MKRSKLELPVLRTVTRTGGRSFQILDVMPRGSKKKPLRRPRSPTKIPPFSPPHPHLLHSYNDLKMKLFTCLIDWNSINHQPVIAPWDAITSLSLWGIERHRLLMNSWLTSPHPSLINAINKSSSQCGKFLMCCFVGCQQFSIGAKSGNWEQLKKHSNWWISFHFRTGFRVRPVPWPESPSPSKTCCY